MFLKHCHNNGVGNAKVNKDYTSGQWVCLLVTENETRPIVVANRGGLILCSSREWLGGSRGQHHEAKPLRKCKNGAAAKLRTWVRRLPFESWHHQRAFMVKSPLN